MFDPSTTTWRRMLESVNHAVTLDWGNLRAREYVRRRDYRGRVLGLWGRDLGQPLRRLRPLRGGAGSPGRLHPGDQRYESRYQRLVAARAQHRHARRV